MKRYTKGFLLSVIAEMINIREKVSYDQRQRLNASTFDGGDAGACIFAQLSGNSSYSEPAREIKRLVANHAIRMTPSGSYSVKTKAKNAYLHCGLTPLETYVFHTDHNAQATKKIILPFLKGKSDTTPTISQL